MKTLIKTIVGLLIAAGIIAGIIYGVKSHNDSTLVAEVVPVSNLMWYDSGSSSLESYGTVTSDSAQNVYVDSSQKVSEVYVEEGDEVSKGDPLLAYDVSDKDLKIQEKELEISKTENTIAQAKAALAKLQTNGNDKQQTADSQVTSITDLEKSLAESQKELLTWQNQKSQETADAEYKAAMKKYEDDETVKQYQLDLSKYEVELDAYNEAWAEYQTALDAYNAQQQRITDNGGALPDGETQLDEPTAPTGTKPTEPAAPENLPKEPEEEYYPSQADINEMIKMYQENIEDLTDSIWWAKFNLSSSVEEKEEELKSLDIDLRREQKELEQLKSADDDGIVYATVDGTVKTAHDTDDIPNDGSAFLTVSASDGLYVKGQISELYLDKITTGMEIYGYTWNTNMSFTATIESVDTTPLASSYYSGEDSAAASYYYFTAYIADATGLNNGDDVQLTLNFDSNTDDEETASAGNIIIEKMYVREEDGKSYVYKQAADGTLTKQYVSTGRSLYGSAVEITSGLTQDDYIAFPYGKTAKEGVTTKVVDYLS